MRTEALKLIENIEAIQEKRILPHFPFSSMIFKDQKTKKGQLTFFVHDISNTGMQIHLKIGDHHYKKDQKIAGNIHWKGENLKLRGVIIWTKQNALGITFEKDKSLTRDLKKFLDIQKIASYLRPLHLLNWDFELPNSLRYWLHTDGPVEIFVWTYSNGEYHKFQFLFFEHFVEWEDAKGVRTGKVLNHRDLETPLYEEDEFAFALDQQVSEERLENIRELFQYIDNEIIPHVAKDFILSKIGPST